MQITPHFSLEEMTRTQTGLENDPPTAVAGNILRLCELLEQIRDRIGPLRINSGYRSLGVNKAVGGVPASAHMLGLAADVVPSQVSLAVMFDLVRDTKDLVWDQLILEPNWVHVGLSETGKTPRRQCLKARRENGRMVYDPIFG